MSESSRNVGARRPWEEMNAGTIREAIALVADPAFQPSLDAWLRVHADSAQYALFFRDTQRERG